MNRNKYLITGITGFAAPHLANLLLSQGNEVFGLTRGTNGRETDIVDIVHPDDFAKIKFLFGDIEVRSALDRVFKQERFDGVFHLAAQSHPPTSFIDPFGTYVTTANGAVNIMEAILRNQPDCKLQFCSTSEVYGAVPEERGAITEDFPLSPINPYAVSKTSADMFARERANSVNAKFFVTRAFAHTGPRRGKNFSISSDAYQLIRIKKGLQEPVIMVGTLSSKRAVIDVRDCVRAYQMLMDTFTPGEAYNVGGDQVYTMDELLDKMIAILGLDGKIEKKIDPKLVRRIDIPVQVCNTAKMRKLTNWQPEIGINRTLSDLLEYWDRKLS